MTEHIPECLNDDDTYGWRRWCICEELRACEQRVRDEIAADGPWFRSVVHKCCEDKQTAYAAGLDAAREAVAALRGCIGTDDRGDGTVWVEKIDALTAIDALKEKP